MSNIANIYAAEILRAVHGPRASDLKVADPVRLQQIAARLAESEEAHGALRAKGYGHAGTTLMEVVREVPVDALGRIKGWFAPKASATPYPDLGEAQNEWSLR
jgi:hypothetical protein